jgi:phosphate transport system substrate-binding protein
MKTTPSNFGLAYIAPLLPVAFTATPTLAAPAEIAAQTEPVNQAAPQKVLHWAGCGITRKAFMKELAAAYEHRTGTRIVLDGGGATKGIRETSNGHTELGGACRWTLDNPTTFRPISAESGVKMVPVAWDALVVITHPDNPVHNITYHQLRDIYTGKINNWKQLGGNDAPIDLLVRSSAISGVGYTIRKLVFANFDQQFSETAKKFPSTGPLEKATEVNPNAIAMTGVGSARRRNLQILTLDGVEPTFENIRDGHYMFYRPLFLVIKKRQPDPIAKDFIRFAVSADGREVIRKAGTVPYRDGLPLIARQIREQNAATRRGLYQIHDGE